MKSLHWNRVLGALEGSQTDGTPVSLWKHYHLQDRAPRRLARITVDFSQRFDLDLIKLTPSGLYGVQDWGVGMQFGNSDEQAPSVINSPIKSVSDWSKIKPLSPNSGALGRELEMCGLVGRFLKDEVPYLMTLFSPLTLAQKLAGDQVYDHLRQEPLLLHGALRAIRDTVVSYADACMEAGVPGFFLATQQASFRLLSVKEYEEFGLAYDQDVATSIASTPIRMLHICGEEIMLEQANQMDVNCLSWSVGGSNPDLNQARKITNRALAAGLSLDILENANEDECRAMVNEILSQGTGTGLILAPDCVVRLNSPDSNLETVVTAAHT